MAWKGRSDLEKLMRRANDRLRSLEAAGETRSSAYNEALRAMRIQEGSSASKRPRFSVSHFKSEAEMRRAMEKFMNMQTSTRTGLKRADMTTAEKMSKKLSTNTRTVKISPADVKKFGIVWEAIRGTSSKYEAGRDLSRQRVIARHINDKDPVELAAILRRMETEGVSPDQWEKQFDRFSKLEQKESIKRLVDSEPLH